MRSRTYAPKPTTRRAKSLQRAARRGGGTPGSDAGSAPAGPVRVASLVLQGHATAQIAERLVVSPHTVQQHLKHIFEKTGVRSRRDLVGKVFFSHFEPRVRDNEHRVTAGQPVRE